MSALVNIDNDGQVMFLLFSPASLIDQLCADTSKFVKVADR
jgi:hypothetical protein